MACQTRTLFLAALAATLMGCGGTPSTGYDGSVGLTSSPPYPVASGDPYNNTTYPTPGNPPASDSPTPVPVPSVPPATGSATPAPVVTSSPDPGATASPSPLPSFVPSSGTGLRIVNIDPTKVLGFCDYIIPCWKAEIRTVSVQNPLMNATQTGRLILSFLSNGTVVADPISEAISLPPAAVKVFGPFKATLRSDTANAEVTTDGQ